MGARYGWQLTFVIIGCIGYIWVAAFWFTYYTPERALKASKAPRISPLKLMKTRFVGWFTFSKVFMDPVWYFITFWIGRYLVDVHHWGLEKIGWFAMFPFIIADIGNILGGLFTQLIIRRGIPVAKARKIAVGLFGSILSLALIIGPLIISGPAVALVVLSIAGFGHAAYTANTMAFPADVVPLNATASVWGVASVGSGLGGAIFQSVSGITIEHLSKTHDYTFAYSAVFIGYGIMAIIAVCVVLFIMGPLEQNKDLAAAPDLNEAKP
jgi:ACS family hexuronate transporter-like MFS transporter